MHCFRNYWVIKKEVLWCKGIMTAGVVALLFVALGHTVGCSSRSPIVLAENGSTTYRIVIAKEAVEAEEHAAKELALFLGEMTGADFPIERDDAPESDFEIVVGDTGLSPRKTSSAFAGNNLRDS